MTTRPHLTILALCIAGMLASGVPLVGVLLGADGWALTVWGGGLGVFVFAGVMAFGLNEGAQVWLRQKAEDLRRDQLANEAKDLANQQGWRALEQAVTDAILATDDDEPATPHKATAAGVWNFFCGGDAVGFAFDSMYAAGLLSQPTWTRLKDFYLLWPQDGPVLVDRGGSAGTVWAATWTLRKVGERLALGDLPLPLGAPPVVGVYIPPPVNTTKRSNTKRGAAGAVVEMEKS